MSNLHNIYSKNHRYHNDLKIGRLRAALQSTAESKQAEFNKWYDTGDNAFSERQCGDVNLFDSDIHDEQQPESKISGNSQSHRRNVHPRHGKCLPMPLDFDASRTLDFDASKKRIA